MSDNSERTVFAPRANARIGTKLNGIYEIESLIAVGGMGEVYKGRAIQTGDAVAIKMIRPEMARCPGRSSADLDVGAAAPGGPLPTVPASRWARPAGW